VLGLPTPDFSKSAIKVACVYLGGGNDSCSDTKISSLFINSLTLNFLISILSKLSSL
jgi:hypothetical protein